MAEQQIDFLDGTTRMYFGVLDSFKLGGIELRNIPVEWSESDTDAADPGGPSDGGIGTWVFYHLLTTFDYAGRSLILRRSTPETARKARADADRAGAKPLPLWLNREHNLLSRGSIADSGPRVMGVNFGGIGEIAAGTSEETAKQLGVRIDYDRPIETFAHSHPAVVYPCYPKEVRIGDAAAKDTYCYARKQSAPAPNGSETGSLVNFDTLGHLPHSFWKPYNITVDFTDMNLYITRGKAS